MDISYLLFLQKAREAFGGVFDSFMMQVTALGEGTATFLLLAVLYWCVDKRIGQSMGLNVALGCTLNQFLKPLFHIDRPWIRDERIHPVEAALPGAGGYSFPSGHTARAVAAWGAVGSGTWKKEKYRLVSSLCWLITAAVLFSRNYLGVHTPQDVLVSLVLGIGILWLTAKSLQFADKHPIGDLLVCGAGCVLCFLPMLKIGCMSNAGAGMGFLIGWLAERRFVRFEISGSLPERLGRLGIGGLLLLAVYRGVGPVLTLFMPAKYAGFFASFFLAVYIMAGYPFLWCVWERARDLTGFRSRRLMMGLAVCVLAAVCLSAIPWQVRRNAQKAEAEAGAQQTEAADSASDNTPIAPEDLQSFQEEGLQIIAHRGYSGVFPENTRSAFAGALDIGVDYIELDVQLSADGQVMVFHDGDLARITGQTGNVADYSRDELLEMDAGSWFGADFAGERIPTLEDALTLIGASDCRIYLELKDMGDVAGFEEAVVEVVKRCDMERQCVLASFNYSYLARIKELDSNLAVLYNTVSGKSTLPDEFPAEYYGLFIQNVTAETIRSIHEAGRKAFVWTVNTPEQMTRVREMGADGIVTNDPGLAKVIVHPEYGFLAEHFEKSITMPGLYRQNETVPLEDYVVQGLTRAGGMIVISAYSYSGAHNSILFVLDTEGNLQKTVDLGFKAHTGGIAYDENRDLLWVTGPSGNVYAFSWPSILEGGYHGEILADFDAGLKNHNDSAVASFLNIYGDELFVGSYVDGDTGMLKRYDVTEYERPSEVAAYVIPQRVQGVTFQEDVTTGERYILFSSGYQTEDSSLLAFAYDEKAERFEEPVWYETLPEGVEQIQMTADGMYILFESAARPYRAAARIPNDQIYLVRV